MRNESSNSEAKNGKQKSVAQRYQRKNFIGSSHAWAYKQLENLSSNARVLDIGPAMGLIGEFLKEQGLTNLSAVEIDAETREKIKSIYQQVEESIEPFKAQQFDVILMLDVLEHMSDPFAFLEELMPMIAQDALVLISVPNVAHWSVRLPLLFGVFNLYDRGILDRTHLQWFTRKRARELANFGSLKLESEDSSIEPAEFVLTELVWNNPVFEFCSNLRVKLANLLPGFFAYQHLMKCRKI
ncbi:MAG: class I SAM-dependent methyltransferase [Bdellovibrionota bacterium]